jgi:cytidylate kinase
MVITISRQFASGGADVARRVAEALGWNFVDRALIDQVAARAGVSPEDVASLEERPPGFLERLIRFSAELPDPSVPSTVPLEDFEEAKLVRVTRQLVTELASQGRVVIVGRASSAILGERPDVCHVRLVAAVDIRIEFAQQLLDIDREAASELLKQRDAERAHYYREFYDVDWNDATHYDLVLNTGRLGFDRAAALIVTHARALGW